MPSDTLLDYCCLDNQSAIDIFFERTQGLHDSCLTGFSVCNPMYVNTSGSMVFPTEGFPGSTSLSIFLQSQFLYGATIELKLAEVEHLRFQGIGNGNDGIVLDAKLTLDENGVLLVCNPDVVDFFEVRAKAAFWRLRNDIACVS
jgi:hypothetical protein